MKKQRGLRIAPYVLIGIGLLFLLDNYGIVERAVGRLWPLILVLIGVLKIFNAYREED